MDIKNLVSAGGKHRHFVAAPLAAAVLIVSLLGTRDALRTASVVTLPAEGAVSHAMGEQLRLSPATAVIVQEEKTDVVSGGVPELRAGTLLLKTEGVLRLKAGPYTLTGLAGGWRVTFRSGALTVAALTSPLLVTDGSGGEVVVPAASQWEAGRGGIPAVAEDPEGWMAARDSRPLPPTFLRKNLVLLSGLDASFLPPAFADEPSREERFWQLPAARERALEDGEGAVIGYLRFLIENKNWEGVGNFMGKDGVAGVLGASPEDAAALLSLAAGERPAALALLPTLARDEDLWLLSSLHPRFRDAAWLLPSPDDTPRAAVLLRLLTVPAADALPDAASEGVAERWEKEAAGFLAVENDPPASLTLLLRGVEPALSRMQESGYLERLSRYASSFRILAQPYRDGLSDEQKGLLKRTTAWADVEAPVAEEPSDVPSVGNPSSVPSLPADEAYARTYNALRDAKALFTVQTTIKTEEDGTVSVRNIIFSGPKRDSSFDFSYDPVRGVARDIIKDGKRLPFALPLGRFVEWARGN